MSSFFKKIEIFHKTRAGLLAFGTVELGLFVLFAGSALYTGNVIDWVLTIALAVGFIQNFVKLTKSLLRSLRG